MAVVGFISRFGSSLRRSKIRQPLVPASRTAGEADPLPETDLLNDKPIPAEHTSPEDVSPEKPEDGNETFEHEIKQIDPTHFEPLAASRKAGLADELAQPQSPDAAQGAAPAAPGAEPSGGPASADPSAQPSPMDAPAAPDSPPTGLPDGAAAPDPVDSAPPAGAPAGAPVGAPPGQDGAKPVFDFEHGLDPASQGQLVNDWQTNVDQKLFSRHTNVIKITQKGNACTFVVQAYNTDTGAKPDLSTGYAADGAERGELMAHLREIFQPNGPAIGHIAGVYNDFIEQQADAGAMPLMRIKPAGSNFEFNPATRSIEGWSDSGMGRDPIWQGTPYSVYTVALTIQFAPIGGQGG